MSTAREARPSGRPAEDTSSNLASLAAELAPLIAAHLAERAVEPEPLIDAKAAGALLGVPDTWVLAQARAGRIPHVRLGHYRRFDRAALLAWRAEQAAGPRTGSRPVPRASSGAIDAGPRARRGTRGTGGGTK